MAKRANLLISESNEKWIQAQIGSKEFSSRSEVLNDLIRKARKTEAIRERLKLAETSAEERGWVTRTADQMLDGFKESARRNGEL